MKTKKKKARELSRKKELVKEKKRYELRRKGKKAIKKQLHVLFPKELERAEGINIEDKKRELSLFYKTLDSQQSKGLITKGRVNRLKSKYTLKFNSLFLTETESDSKTEK